MSKSPDYEVSPLEKRGCEKIPIGIYDNSRRFIAGNMNKDRRVGLYNAGGLFRCEKIPIGI